MDASLEAAAGNPRRTTIDGVTAEEHSLPDLIALDNHLQARRAARRTPAQRLSGLCLKIVPPGGG